ncbi:MAG: prepilin-type N-terminal cleavage/methylation domain-containing protein [Elusimicrobiaceae bacterium]|nr:prepilin-type N-terminal cleavage/methylation domain-containing protein [Elusimicrobiaceae bacterium]
MKNKIHKKGFTLIEMLVVVLIIGILTAIALPQYRLAVAKSQYSTLKNATKSLKDAVDRYYLVHSSYPTKFADLDVDFSITGERDAGSSFYIYFPGVDSCEIYHSTSNHNIICLKRIAGKRMTYTQGAYPWTNRVCGIYSIDTNDISNRVCQAETDKTATQASCGDNRCVYNY